MTRGPITARQIEAGRRAINRHVKRGGKVWIRVFPDKPITAKPLEVRQGKGKGNVDHWAFPVQPGRVLYEIEGVSEELAREAFRRAAASCQSGPPLCSGRCCDESERTQRERRNRSAGRAR